MNDFLNDVKAVLDNSFTINYDKKTMYNYFIAEDYPAICYEPNTSSRQLQGLGAVMGDSAVSANIYYITRATENRDITAFILEVDNIINTLVTSTNLNSKYININASTVYLTADSSDDVEFKVKININAQR